MKFPIFLLFLIISAGIASAKGDCNADGKITSVDALIALKMSVGKIEPREVADMNGDGAVTSYDAFKILMLATGDEEDLFFILEDALKGQDIGKYLDNERMNWIIAKKDGSKLTVGVVVENKKLKDFFKGEVTNPSMNIYSNEETVRRILNSKNPDEIKEGIKNGEIRIEGVGIVNQIRVTVMNLFSKFL
uniref:Dockerin domain-containing protein n=1 Tax=Geoglobus ahangari TaxID=113653 RepID=A0A7J3TJH6_9EURY